MKLGRKEFDLVIARSVTVELHGKGGDVAVPDSMPMVKVRCEITTFYANKGSGETRRRNSTRTMYYQLEYNKFTRTPTGQKGWDDEFSNRDDVVDYIRECLTGIGSGQ